MASKTKKKSPIVKMDRRAVARTERRTSASGTDRRVKDVPAPVERRKMERREKVVRRRQIDPTTCERDYTLEELEFMNALEQYKRANGRMFPTCSEILEVVKKMGYQRITPANVPALDAAPIVVENNISPAVSVFPQSY